MKSFLRLIHFPSSLLALMFLLLTSCASTAISTNISTDPQPVLRYILVTANPQATPTPFQPLPPTSTPPPTETPLASPTATSTNTPLPTETPASTPTGLPAEPQASPNPPASNERPQYALTVLMDYSGHSLTVSETVVYPNRSRDTLTSLPLAINPNLWNSVFSLQSISINGRDSSNYTLSGQWLTVNLDAPLQTGQAVTFGIAYQLALPNSAGKFENFGYNARQINLIDWYPFVPPYRDGKWLLPDPYSYGENLVYEKADFRVNLSFADPANAPVVAASSPAVLENSALVYNLPNARNFTISASPEYLFSTADANGVTIYNYYYPEDANAAAMVLELTRMSVNTYSTEFGPYAHSALTVCETNLNDGLETDGLYFLSHNFYASYDGSVKNNLSVIAVHETAHEWWYGAVANDQANEPWLDEAMATYSEHVFYEDNYPELLNWWWNFRVYYYGATGWVDSRVYDSASFRAYVNAVYFNGARFLQALRDRTGDQAFFAFLRDYYARENGRIATASDFFAILDLHTSADYSDLLKAFFYYR
jgi:hypothetical protein